MPTSPRTSCPGVGRPNSSGRGSQRRRAPRPIGNKSAKPAGQTLLRPDPCASRPGTKPLRTAVATGLLSLAYAKDLGVAHGADARCSRTPVLQGYLLWVPYLLLSPALEAISLHNLHPHYIESARSLPDPIRCNWIPRWVAVLVEMVAVNCGCRFSPCSMLPG